MKPIRLGIDIDGVIADFDRPFCQLLEQLTGKPCPYEDPDRWEWPERRGFTAAEEAAAWKYVTANPSWWLKLPVYGDATGEINISTLEQAGHSVYFVTARHAAWTKFYSTQWVRANLGVQCPTVICSKHKGLVAKALDLDCFIDDKPEHAVDVKVLHPHTRTYLRARKHNEPARAYLERLGVVITDSLQTMLNRELDRLRPSLTAAG